MDKILDAASKVRCRAAAVARLIRNQRPPATAAMRFRRRSLLLTPHGAQINPAGAGTFITGVEAEQKVRFAAPAAAPCGVHWRRRRRLIRDAARCLLRAAADAAAAARPQRKSVVKITTGSNSVDEVLGGGVESQARPSVPPQPQPTCGRRG